MKKLILLTLLILFSLSSCGGVPESLICEKCDTENEIINLYCSNCATELLLEEKVEERLDVERIDNRVDIVKRMMNEGKYKQAWELLRSELESVDKETAELLKECVYILAGATEDHKEAYDYYLQIIDYKDAEEKAKERYYKLGLQKIEENSYKEAYNIFFELGDYEDSEVRAKEIAQDHIQEFYDEGEKNYIEGKYDAATKCLKFVGSEDAKKILEYIALIEELQGVYDGEGIWAADHIRYIVLEGNKLYTYDLDDGTMEEEEIVIQDTNYGFCLMPNSYYNNPEDVWEPKYIGTTYEGEKTIREEIKVNRFGEIDTDLYIYEITHSMSKESLDKKIASYVEPAEKVEPAIGMTADEVRASTWGSPIDINKTTYAWGVEEQWVYSNYRYIYLEDGIVTTIQE